LSGIGGATGYAEYAEAYPTCEVGYNKHTLLLDPWWKILVAIGVYCVNCTKFGQLNLRKISEIVATRCLILRLKCTEFNFGAGELTALPRTL